MSSNKAISRFRAWMAEWRAAQDDIYKFREPLQEAIKLARKNGDLAAENAARALMTFSPPQDKRVRFWKDWHTLANKTDIQQFLAETSKLNWGPKRRGEAFERWIRLRKSRGLDLGKIRFEESLLKDLDIEMKNFKWREPDRFRIRSKSMWDHKHYLPQTVFDTEQFKTYLDIISVDAGPDGVDRICYLFSDASAAANNRSRFVDALKAKPLPAGKSVHIFYVDQATSQIKRDVKLITSGIAK
jgi:hypothetical protein